MSSRPKQPIGAGILLYDPRRDTVLLGMRSPKMKYYPAQWGIPGGRVEIGESPLDGALRELDEEFIGYAEINIFSDEAIRPLSPLLGSILGMHVVDIETPRGPWMYTTYVITVELDEPLSVYPSTAEHISARWVSLDEATSLKLMQPFADALPHLQQITRTA